MDRRTESAGAIADAVADIRRIEAEHGVTRDSLERIKARLIALAQRTDLFTPADFPPPEADGKLKSCLYRLSEDGDHRFALYANSARAGVNSPPHDHTTWAVIVGVAGNELNRFYVKDAKAGVAETRQAVVRQGTGVAILPDEVHSIHIAEPVLNFHMYGRALEQLDARRYYDSKKGEWIVFPAHGDIREARP